MFESGGTASGEHLLLTCGSCLSFIHTPSHERPPAALLHSPPPPPNPPRPLRHPAPHTPHREPVAGAQRHSD
jgi:hypothetical protein